ncbi:uncharacterized protein LOC120672245 [Panicum virgatum]|uniref:J domain-containing protein n=1 Tax=Panicum virgatum TaxID=38727 RepID=A0A8T0S5R6_PANVG|nr:uncharacterized protein LOC120672245 [Panicum virgatum]KAG2593951.1 hypothetical protein PVAP13_5NG264419 [Panicum virgatum]
MECNRDDAARSKSIAERKFRENDFAGAKRFALKAKALFKPLEGIDQMIVALDVHIRAQEKIGGENDWYGILKVSPLADEEAIKKRYKKLAFKTHPGKNSSICAEAAFNLISDAWSVLSDTTKRMAYDHKRHLCGIQNNYKASARNTSNSSTSSVNGFCDRPTKVAPHPAHQVPATFWTQCRSCFRSIQYSREYVNQFLKCPVCHEVFVAAEVPPPSSPIYPHGPTAMATNNDIGGNTVPGMATPGVQAGVSCSNQNGYPAVLKSTTCANRTRYTVQGNAGEANIATNEAADSREVMKDVRKHAPAVSSVKRANAATRVHEAAKRKRVNGGNQATWQSASTCPDGDGCKPIPAAKRGPRSTAQNSGAKKRKVSSADLNCESSGAAGRTTFGRVLMQLDVRGILIGSGKLRIREKLQELNSKKASVKNKEKMQNSKKSSTKGVCNTTIDVNKIEMKPSISSVDPKVDAFTKLVSKRVDSEEMQREKCSKQVGQEEKLKSWQWRSREVHIVYTRRNRKEHKKELEDGVTSANPATEHNVAGKNGCLNQESPDKGSGEMSVPDADFFNFGDHSESSFQNDQVWAMYDEEDGMPRYYALIRKVLSTHPFKARLAYLKANDCNEFGSSNWISYGYSKTCGEFKVGAPKGTDQVNIFSHKVNCDKGPGGIIRIFPKKGDIWALYQNWSPDWDEFTPDDTMYKYELVQVIDSYNPAEGISVIPIVKVPGFVSVFKPFHDAKKSWRIPKEEMLRFSHQVPFHVLTGEEAPNAPKGCYELDPGSTPQELQVVQPTGDAK